ncbi:MAG TPA: sarcosine oxidase subunit delta [Geminicoccaceae bacterium]
MRIPCPHCGERDHAEFTYAGDATVRRPAPDEGDPAAWMRYVYWRDNPCGPHDELWQHSAGCRRFIVVRRDTLSHAILGARDAAEPR